MSRAPLASVIVDNYNYGRYLAAAIDSALAQTWPAVEVVVVDDGSTDDSRQVIARYGDRVTPVLKENGGMDTAFNAGYRASRGDVVLFLDADDLLLPTAVERAVERFAPGVSKVHWPLWVVDREGVRSGGVIPPESLGEGDLRAAAAAVGPDAYLSPPTSGNAWSRKMLDRVMPMPESGFKRHAEMYLATLAPVFGSIRSIPDPQSCYRFHGANDYALKSTHEKHRRNAQLYQHRCGVLSAHLRATGTEVNAEQWLNRDGGYKWMRDVVTAADEIASVVPPGDAFVLIDENQWSDSWLPVQAVEGRRSVPFLERHGQYWGPPADDQTAIREIERMRASGASFVAFAWPAFWWIDHYQGFARYLRETYSCRLENSRVIVFDLRRT